MRNKRIDLGSDRVSREFRQFSLRKRDGVSV